MSLWLEVDTIGKEIEHRGLKIRQMSHDLLFGGLSGDRPEAQTMFSIEPYSVMESFTEYKDVILDCIRIRRENS